MKKAALIVSMILVSISAYSQGTREIRVTYRHSLRIPYNVIDIRVISANNQYDIKLSTAQMEGKTGYEYSNTEKIIQIDEEYFEMIYKRILDLDFREIILKNEHITGTDGVDVEISIGNFQNNIILQVWSPGYKPDERNLEELLSILKDIFVKIGLEQYYK